MAEPSEIKTIVIVGGGTAGWMAANLLMARKRHRVVVVESADIGTVGVGEALTPFFHVLLSHLQYDPLDFVRDVGGSIKLAVRFENWRGTGDVYYHPFLDGGSYFGLPEFAVTPGYNRLLSYGVLEGLPLHDLTTSYALLCEQSRVPWLQDFRLDSDQRFGFGSYAFHMDTRRFSETFRARATRLGVEHLQGEVVDVVHEPARGFIERLVLKDGRTVEGDFFIDCSGFRRVLISRFAPEWESYASWLPVDRAIPFHLGHGDPDDARGHAIPPCTQALAMKAGWLWKIPLMERYGAGYVFSSAFCSESEAAAEIEASVPPGQRGDLGRPIQFRSGTFKETWVKNCVAVGLASGFIEPLESTSIQILLTQLLGVIDVLRSPFNFDEELLRSYNTAVKLETDDIRDFIIAHYVTDRDDTPFWRHIRDIKERLDYPDTVREKLRLARYRTFGQNRVQSEQIRGRVFGELSGAYVLQGMGLLHRENAEADFLQEYESVEHARRALRNPVRGLQNQLVRLRRTCMGHREFLARVRAL